MLTNHELSTLNLSPTKKDFVQIWNELLEVAQKLSERWDPSSTNESDPGIVLLKALTGIADKLNYNIDKNILEAYMPTAAQEESMRKLCDMMGYNLKYYHSATTTARVQYTADQQEKPLTSDVRLAIPKFTTLMNADKDITYFTTNENDVYISAESPYVDIPCMEGQVVQCESINEHNIITLAQLDTKNRYYLPETQIAENGIFVYNVASQFLDGATENASSSYVLRDGDAWKLTDNLNTAAALTRVFKFGFDSLIGRPYIEFPEDVSRLIQNGIFIYFTRTSGLRGNISARTLSQIELPSDDTWQNYAPEDFTVFNASAASDGTNIESISQAYLNFKKTVGTFDTLVTCRDYMNKIYSLTSSSTNGPAVSNILVTDIRNDLNKAITLCSCNEYGIYYIEKSLQDNSDKDLITHFDLMLYPYKTYTQVGSGADYMTQAYNNSFCYDGSSSTQGIITRGLENSQTISHNIRYPSKGDIVSIKNYLRLDAIIATSMRVSAIESETIIDNIKTALIKAFNARNLDFGEEIPFESILSVIESADSRIKAVSLAEPSLLTTFAVLDENEKAEDIVREYGIVSTDTTTGQESPKVAGVNYTSSVAKSVYNKLALRNILAGRVSMFDYEETFRAELSEHPYEITEPLDRMDNLLNGVDLTAVDEDGILTDTTQLEELYTEFATKYGHEDYAGGSDVVDSTWPALPTFSSTEQVVANNAAKTKYLQDVKAYFVSVDANAKRLESLNAPYTSVHLNKTSDVGYNWLHLYPTDDTQGAYLTEPPANNGRYRLGCAWSSGEGKDLEFAYFTGELVDGKLTVSKDYEFTDDNVGKVLIQSADDDEFFVLATIAPGVSKYLVVNANDSGLEFVDEDSPSKRSFRWDTTKCTLATTSSGKQKGLGIANDSALTVLSPVEYDLQGYSWAKLYLNKNDNWTAATSATELEPGVDYRLAINCDGVTRYFTGSVKDRGYETTTDSTKATTVRLERAGGEDKFWIYRVDPGSNAKIYLLLTSNAEVPCSVVTASSSATLFKWDATVNTVVAQIVADSFSIGTKKLLKPSAIALYDTSEPPKKMRGPHGGELSVVFNRDAYGNVTTEKDDKGNSLGTKIVETYQPYEAVYPVASTPTTRALTPSGKITKLSATCKMPTKPLTNTPGGPSGIKDLLLSNGEQIKFRAPNLITTKTYPAYINYNLQRSAEVEGGNYGTPAVVQSLRSFLWKAGSGVAVPVQDSHWKTLLSESNISKLKYFTKIAEKTYQDGSAIAVSIDDIFRTAGVVRCKQPIATAKSGLPTYLTSATDFQNRIDEYPIDTQFYFLPLNSETLTTWNDLLPTLDPGLKAIGSVNYLCRLSAVSESYVIGKHVTSQWRKVLVHSVESINTSNCPFDIGYVLLAEGSDASPSFIKDGEDYQLQDNEKLYIQYTPSSSDATEDTQVEPVSLVYGAGTIIRPTGFTLYDSDFSHRQGVSWKKQNVVFNDNGSSRKVHLMTLGASEQIEIRELSRVTLAGPVCLYKNFDNETLETVHPRQTTKYLLKDGEYLFYSDLNHVDAAYYGSGTEIVLDPGAVLPKASHKVDIATIFEEGLHKIPWKTVSLSKNRTIKLTEYQYNTLIEGDTAVEIPLVGGVTALTGDWVECTNSHDHPVKYKLKGDDTVHELGLMNITGYGWEACCTLALNVSSESPQLLRSDDKVQSSLKLYYDNDLDEQFPVIIEPKKVDLQLETFLSNTTTDVELGGEAVHETGIVAPLNVPQVENSLSFKTNLVCQSADGAVSISSDATTPLQVKIFTDEQLKIDEELPGSFSVPSEIDISTAPQDDILTPVERITTAAAGVSAANSSLISVSVEGLAASLSEMGDGSTQKIIKEHPLTLNLDIPSSAFGIFSIYYDPAQTDKTDSTVKTPDYDKQTYLEVATEDLSKISIYNNRTLSAEEIANEDPDSWWCESLNGFNGVLSDTNIAGAGVTLPSKPYTSKLKLKVGLNCIKVTDSCRIDIKAMPKAGGSLLIDRLRLVKHTSGDFSGVNIDLLDYQQLDVHPEDNTKPPLSADAQLLYDIRKIDKKQEFYYNAHIEDSLAIELNPTATGHLKMSAPSVLYDVNNINNHFVLSELDINYLDSGLSIARSSKLS